LTYEFEQFVDGLFYLGHRVFGASYFRGLPTSHTNATAMAIVTANPM
jgi:hypothetical protein